MWLSGIMALKYNTANNGVALGHIRHYTANTDGLNNTALGSNALASNTTGDHNLAIGFWALDAADQENHNLAIGTSCTWRSYRWRRI